MVRVKICGIENEAQAVQAAEAGADFIGVVLAPSRRQISPGQAWAICAAVKLSGQPAEVVGVFVNRPAAEVNRIAKECGFDRVQLSGEETPEYCLRIETPIIKAVHVGTVLPDLKAQRGLVYLLDTMMPGKHGGTGTIFNWDLASAAAQNMPLILAGGLTPSNVGEAVRRVAPWGVDVSSGVETDGVKDMKKVRAFIEAARRPNDKQA